MIRSVLVKPDGSKQYNIQTSQYQGELGDPKNLLWVSLENPTPEEIAVLTTHFKFHPLTVEDCLSTGYQTPKIDEFEQYVFIICHAILPYGDMHELNSEELDMFVGINYLVTCYFANSMEPVSHIMDRIEKDERLVKNGPDFLCYSLMDKLVDDYLPLIDHIEDEIEYLEDRILETPSPDVLERILLLKHSIISLRKVVMPLRETMNRLSRDEIVVIDQRTRIYFRDIYDHLVRVQDLSENIRDIISSAMDIYLSSTSLRLNEIMKALTVVSTIFLPLSFVAGVYGMNFSFMPELSWKYGYLLAWGIFLTIAIGMLVWFNRRKWF